MNLEFKREVQVKHKFRIVFKVMRMGKIIKNACTWKRSEDCALGTPNLPSGKDMGRAS